MPLFTFTLRNKVKPNDNSVLLSSNQDIMGMTITSQSACSNVFTTPIHFPQNAFNKKFILKGVGFCGKTCYEIQLKFHFIQPDVCTNTFLSYSINSAGNRESDTDLIQFALLSNKKNYTPVYQNSSTTEKPTEVPFSKTIFVTPNHNKEINTNTGTAGVALTGNENLINGHYISSYIPLNINMGRLTSTSPSLEVTLNDIYRHNPCTLSELTLYFQYYS